jgi:lipid-A-disaccharide synthase
MKIHKILLLAGEESGLLYAERLKDALQDARPDEVMEFRGYQSEGFKTADLAVMGFWPVLKKLFFFLGVARAMKRLICDWQPEIVVTVDYPGLNLKLAAFAKARGIPAVHLVCPQVWAWHQGRIPKVAAALTKLLCFFPFEPALFRDTGLDARFIGHPLVDMFAAENADAAPARTKGSAKTLALLPGSRLGEIQRIMPRLLAALHLLADKGVSDVEIRIPAANEKA